MKILVVGAGAIGSFIGGVLKSSGQELTFFDLPPVVKRVREEGIRVDGLKGDILIKDAKAISCLEDLDFYDLAVISVKSYSTKVVIKNLPDNLALKILTFQNGLGNEEVLAEKFGKEKIVAGSITYPVSYPKPGHVVIENSDAGVGIAPVDSSVDIDDLFNLFVESGLNIVRAKDYRSLKWSKLILNLICNANCAILGMTPGELFKNVSLVKIEREQILEILTVMKAKRIPIINLPGYPVKILAYAYLIFPPFLLRIILNKPIAQGRGKKKPSMLIDLERGIKCSEVKYLNGAVYYQGANIAVPICYNKVISETLEEIAKGSIPWENFKGNPEAFINLFKKCH